MKWSQETVDAVTSKIAGEYFAGSLGKPSPFDSILAQAALAAVSRSKEVLHMVTALRNSNIELGAAFNNCTSIIGKEMIQMRIESNAKALLPFTEASDGK